MADNEKSGWYSVHPKDPIVLPKSYFRLDKTSKNKQETRSKIRMEVIFLNAEQLSKMHVSKPMRAVDKAKNSHSSVNKSRDCKPYIPQREASLLSPASAKMKGSSSEIPMSPAKREEDDENKMDENIDLSAVIAVDPTESVSEGYWDMDDKAKDNDVDDDPYGQCMLDYGYDNYVGRSKFERNDDDDDDIEIIPSTSRRRSRSSPPRSRNNERTLMHNSNSNNSNSDNGIISKRENPRNYTRITRYFYMVLFVFFLCINPYHTQK